MSVSSFLNKVVPMFQKYGAQYKFHIISFAIAQACLESGYGTSSAAINKNNILGIGPGKYYSSWDACVKGYYTDTVLGGMAAARDATTLDAYYKAFVASNYCPGTEAQYYSSIKSIINENNLTKYDSKNGSSLSGSANVLEDFLKVAKQHSNGESFEEWTRGVLGMSGYADWCAYFICACAKKVGVLGKIIPEVGWVDGMMDGVKSLGGTLHSANSYTPKPGDLFSLHRSGQNSGYHIGIVYSVSGNSFTSCEGNHVTTSRSDTGGLLSGSSTYTFPNGMFYQFATPDWGAAGGSYTGLSDSAGGGVLYSTSYTRADAIIREVGYLDKNYNETLTPSKMRLCVINYTPMLADLWGLYGYGGDSSSTSDSYDTSELSGNCKTTIDYLIGKGLNAAAACGVAGNIYHESGFNTSAVGDGGTSFGICQWHEGRGAAMKKFVGSSWANNLSRQLDYLWYELENSYSGVLSTLRSVSNTESGCKSAADAFVRRFEVPADVDNESVKRQNTALSYFKKIKSGGTVSDGSVANKQKKVIDAAETTPNSGASLCGQWIANVFNNAGLGRTFYAEDACGYYADYCKYSNKSQLKPGMVIAVDSHANTYMGSLYGHVGLYVGNNKVYAGGGSGGVLKDDLDWWIDYYTSYVNGKLHSPKWGWCYDIDLTK